MALKTCCVGASGAVSWLAGFTTSTGRDDDDDNDSCRHGIIRGADVDPRRGVANEHGLLSDDDDIDGGELDCVGSESLSTKRFPRHR